MRKFTDFTGAILVRGSRDGSWKTAKQKILWKSPRITLPRAILASTFIPSLRVPKIQAYTAPQGGAKRTSCQRTRIATRVAESAKRKPFECRRESRRRYTGRSKQSPSTVASVARHLKSVGLEHLENMRSPLLRAAPHIPLRESNFFRSHREEW